MLVRIVQFLFGALLAGGGGYLGWMNRSEFGTLFPSGPGGPPWLLVLGVLGVAAGIVFLVSAVHPRPNRRREIEAREATRTAQLGEAEAYYAEAGRAADRDWRSGDLPPPVTPQAQALPDAPEPAPEPAPVQPVVAMPSTAQAPSLSQPIASAAPQPAPQRAVEPASPDAPAAPAVFPSAAALAPIPVAVETSPAVPATPAAAPVAATPVAATADANAPIREAIKAGRLEEAERLLDAGRETAQGLALAELTGLAGDHAAASGRQSHARWLWRLAIKRFGEANAMDSSAARAVAENLRVNG